MATPESNTALGLQLFQPATRVITDANDQRTSLLARLAEIGMQQRFQREQLASQQQFAGQQATQQQGAAVNLENLRNQNQQVTNDKIAERQSALADRTLDRQLQVAKQEQDAREMRDIHQQFQKTYPAYVQAAEQLGETPKVWSDYEQSADGLGQLTADMEAQKVRAEKKKEKETAAGMVGMLLPAIQSNNETLARIRQNAQLSDEDITSVKEAGLAALNKAYLNGQLPGVTKDQFGKGLSALSAKIPDVKVAEAMFGTPSALIAYQQGARQQAYTLANSPERKAQIAADSREAVASQGTVRALTGDVMKEAAKNPEIPAAMENLRARYPDAFNPAAVEKASRPPDIDSIFLNKLGMPPQRPAGSPSPQAAGPTSPGIMSRLGALFARGQDPTMPQMPGGSPVIQSQAPIFNQAPQPASIPANEAPVPALRSIAPQPQTYDWKSSSSIPPEVNRAALMISGGGGSDADRAVLRQWLENNGNGQPYAPQNVQLQRMVTPQPAY